MMLVAEFCCLNEILSHRLNEDEIIARTDNSLHKLLAEWQRPE